MAANAFSGEQLAAKRTSNLRDLQQLTPSLVVTNTNPLCSDGSRSSSS